MYGISILPWGENIYTVTEGFVYLANNDNGWLYLIMLGPMVDSVYFEFCFHQY